MRLVLRTLVGAAVVGGFGVAQLPTPPAHAAAGAAFLDERPVVIDLAVAERHDRWSVEVVVPLTEGADAVAMTAVMSPPSLSVSRPETPPRPVSTTVAIVEFSIRLEEADASSGALVLSDTNGVVARRPVRILTAGTNLQVPAELEGQGVRTHPFGGGIRVRPIELPNPDLRTPRVVGRLFNGTDSAQVVQTDLDLVFNGIEQTGRYKGVVDLVPALDGGDTKVDVAVADQMVWPLVTIVAGLGIVSALDIGRRRRRPERVLALQLRRLLERAKSYQLRNGVSLRVTGDRADPLLLDELTSTAMAEFRGAVDDGGRHRWTPGEPAFDRLVAVVDRFGELCERQQAIAEEQKALMTRLPASRRPPVEVALAGSIVGRSLAPNSVRTKVELDAADTTLTTASSFLTEFSATLERLLSPLASPDAARGVDLLETLLTDPKRLPEVSAAAAQLRLAKVTSPDVRDVRERPLAQREGVPHEPPPSTEGVQGGTDERPVIDSNARGRLASLGAAAVALVVVVVVLSGQAQFPGSDGGSAGGDVGIQPTGLSPAPTEAELVPRGTVEQGAPPEAFEKAILAAVALLAIVAGFTWLAVRRRPAGYDEERSAAELERSLQRGDRQLSFVSGILIVLSGLLALYIPNASFGGAGDYLGALLWGTTLSTGVELARRFTSQPIVP